MTQRLGYLRGGAEDVIGHAFLKPLDVSALLEKEAEKAKEAAAAASAAEQQGEGR